MATNLKSDEKSYDPYLHREVEKPISNVEAFILLVRGSIGIGIVIMPDAFKDAGYINGMIFSVIFGLILVHAMNILLKTRDRICAKLKVPFLTYPDAMAEAFNNGPPSLQWLSFSAMLAVDLLLMMLHFGLCCSYVVFIAETIKEVTLEKGRDLHLAFYILGVGVPLMIIITITSFKALKFMSLIVNVLQLFAFGILIYYIIVFDNTNTKREAFADWKLFPLFVGITLFTLEGIGVIITVDEQMKTPQSYLGTFGVLNISMVVSSIFHVGLGFLGYWKYGEDTAGSITLNLPRNEILSNIAKLAFALSFAISYVMQGFLTVDVIWNHYIKDHCDDYNHHRYEVTVRVITSLLTIFFAMVVPKFSHYLSLMGSVYLSTLGLIFPALMEIVFNYPDNYGRLKYILIRDILLIVGGIVGGVSGAYASIYWIGTSYSEDEVVSFFAHVT